MAYWNQQPNCGYQNQGNMRGRRQQSFNQSASQAASAMNMMGRNQENCDVVIVSEHQDCMVSDRFSSVDGLPLAMAYVPWQKFENLYCDADAFKNGTIFKDLDLEFMKRGCN